jgi:hypothetical protein
MFFSSRVGFVLTSITIGICSIGSAGGLLHTKLLKAPQQAVESARAVPSYLSLPESEIQNIKFPEDAKNTKEIKEVLVALKSDILSSSNNSVTLPLLNTFYRELYPFLQQVEKSGKDSMPIPGRGTVYRGFLNNLHFDFISHPASNAKYLRICPRPNTLLREKGKGPRSLIIPLGVKKPWGENGGAMSEFFYDESNSLQTIQMREYHGVPGAGRASELMGDPIKYPESVKTEKDREQWDLSMWVFGFDGHEKFKEEFSYEKP